MAGIFLSYSREDRAFADLLARFLERAGHDVWWDRDIDSGNEFSNEIEAALERAEIVVVAWSRSSAKSAWVRDEAAIGRDSGRLAPVLIDGSQPPMGFRQFQALDLTGWKGAKRDPRSTALLNTIERRAKGRGAAPRKAAEPKQAIGSPKRRPFWVAAAVLLLVLGTAGAAFFVFMSKGEQGGRTTKPTMGLAAFKTASPDPQLRDTATQVRDALSHMLAQSGVPVRLLDSVSANSKGADDFVIAGEVSRSAEKLIVTVRLDEATQGVTVFSKQFEAKAQEVRDFPERIGAQMASMLSNGAILLTLDRRHPVDPAVMTELLSGEGKGDDLGAYQTDKRLAAKAPDVASVQVGVAFLTGFVLDLLPRDERPQAIAEGRRAYERALKLAPGFGDTYAAWCLLHSDALLVACEDHLRTGNRVDADAPYLNTFLAGLLMRVGRLNEAFDVARLSYSHDPYDPPKIRDMLRMLEFSGDEDGARKLYEDGSRWWPEARPAFSRSRIFGLLARGDFDAMARVEREVGTAGLPSGYRPSAPIAAAIRSKSVAALRTACPADGDFLLKLRCMIAFSTVGELDQAYVIADKMYAARVGRTPADTERIWIDSLEDTPPLNFITSAASGPMRRDPRYIELARRVGLLDYWRSGRLPDFCRKNPEPVCQALLARR